MSDGDQMYNNQAIPANLTPIQLQQWQQWQQQYQQWQQLYGQQYEQSMRAMNQGGGAPPLPQSGNPPLPVAPVPAATVPLNPPLPQSAPPEELSEAEKNFDVQFKQWEQQYEDWKKQNANHPDKTQYSEYEKKWEAWREQLLERREEMKKKRLGSKLPPRPKEDPPLPSQPAPALPPANPFNSEPLVFKPKPDHFRKEGQETKPPPKAPAEKPQTLHQLGSQWGNFPPNMPHEQAGMIRQQIEIMCSNLPPQMPLEQRHMIMHQMQTQACNFSFDMPAEQKHMLLNQMMMHLSTMGPNMGPGMNPMGNQGSRVEHGDDYGQPAFSTDTPWKNNNRRSPDRRPNDMNRFPDRPGPFGRDNFGGNFGMGDSGNFNGPWGPGFNNGSGMDGPRGGNMGPGFNNGPGMDGPRGGNMGPGYNNGPGMDGPWRGNMRPGNFNKGSRDDFGMDDYSGDMMDERSRSPGGLFSDRGGRGGRGRNRRGRGNNRDAWDGPPQDRGGRGNNRDVWDGPPQDRGGRGNNRDAWDGPPQDRGGRGNNRDAWDGPAQDRGSRGNSRDAWDGPPQDRGSRRGPAGFDDFSDRPWGGNDPPPPPPGPSGRNGPAIRGLMDEPISMSPKTDDRLAGDVAEFKGNNNSSKKEAPWTKYERDEYNEDPFADDGNNQNSNSYGGNQKGDNFRPGFPGLNMPERDRLAHGDEDLRGPNNFGNRNFNEPPRGPPVGSQDFRDSRSFGPNSGGPRFDQDFRGPGPADEDFRRGPDFPDSRGGPWMDDRAPRGPNNDRGPGFSTGPRFPPRGGPNNDQNPTENNNLGANKNQGELPGLVAEKNKEPMTTFEDLKLKTNSDPVALSGFVGNILAKLGVSSADADSKAMEVTKILLADKQQSQSQPLKQDTGSEGHEPEWKPVVHDYANKPPLTRREQEVRELAFQVRDYSHGEFKPQTYDYGHGGGGNSDIGPKKFDYSHGAKNKFDYGHGGDGGKKQFDYGHGGSVAPKTFDYGHGGGRSPSPIQNRSRKRDRSRDRSPSPYRNRSRMDRSPDRRWESKRDRGRDRGRDFGRGRDRSPLRSGSPRRSPPRRKFEEHKDVKSKTDEGTQAEAAGQEAVGGVLLEDLICEPGRQTRPRQMVFIMRGVSGSGKSFVTKLIKDKESESGGSAPRILSMDDYFMADVEVEETDEVTGQKTKKKVMKYEYDADMEEVYEAALLKAFKKTVSDGFFGFVIVDAVNKDLKQVEDMWSFAKQKGFQVYVCEMDNDAALCAKRNIHGRSETEIQTQEKGWQSCPGHYLRLDVRSLLQSEAIEDVEMEDVEESSQPASDENSQESRKEDEDEPAISNFLKSKWEDDESSGQQLDRLDGLKKKKPTSMEAFLSPDDFEDLIRPERATVPGKKNVRWADLEERQQQEKMRAIGFVVGQTDWKRMMDPTSGESALTRTKYI